jgi:hypothetical protein
VASSSGPSPNRPFLPSSSVFFVGWFGFAATGFTLAVVEVFFLGHGRDRLCP